jgi:hypothetical protein
MKRARPAAPLAAPVSGTPSLAAGYLATLPLFLAYELGLLVSPTDALRSSAARAASAAFAILGEHERYARWALLVALAVAAGERLARGRGLDARALLRAAGLGVLVGVLLGPLLVLLHGWLGAEPLAVADPAPRSLPRVLRLVGAAPWEELLFRVGAYSCAYFGLRRVLEFFGLAGRATQAAAELGALLVSAALFSAFHLELVQQHLGARGEPYHAGLFVWRLSAGIVLAGLFRWKGLAVAAWAHALFNLGLALGIELL